MQRISALAILSLSSIYDCIVLELSDILGETTDSWDANGIDGLDEVDSEGCWWVDKTNPRC